MNCDTAAVQEGWPNGDHGPGQTFNLPEVRKLTSIGKSDVSNFYGTNYIWVTINKKARKSELFCFANLKELERFLRTYTPKYQYSPPAAHWLR